jgi:hypothetical protein
MLNPAINPEEHHSFVRNEGGLFWSSSGFAAAEYVAGMDFEPLQDGSPFEPLPDNNPRRPQDPTMIGLEPISHPLFDLQLRTWRQMQQDLALGEISDNTNRIARLNSYGAAIDNAALELVDQYSNIGFGLTDPQFTLHFSSLVATACMARLVDAGAIPQEQIGSLNMADYATMLQSNWFSRLMHTCTPANFGYWAETGKYATNYFMPVYHLTGLSAHEDRSGKWLVTAGAADRKAMRDSLKEDEKSTGCPVVYKHYSLAEGQTLGLRYAEHLQALGHAVLDSFDDGTTQVHLDQTPITAMLHAWGGKIHGYVAAYGEPRYDKQTQMFVHTPLNPSGFQDVIAA